MFAKRSEILLIFWCAKILNELGPLQERSSRTRSDITRISRNDTTLHKSDDDSNAYLYYIAQQKLQYYYYYTIVVNSCHVASRIIIIIYELQPFVSYLKSLSSTIRRFDRTLAVYTVRSVKQHFEYLIHDRSRAL